MQERDCKGEGNRGKAQDKKRNMKDGRSYRENEVKSGEKIDEDRRRKNWNLERRMKIKYIKRETWTVSERKSKRGNINHRGTGERARKTAQSERKEWKGKGKSYERKDK